MNYFAPVVKSDYVFCELNSKTTSNQPIPTVLLKSGILYIVYFVMINQDVQQSKCWTDVSSYKGDAWKEKLKKTAQCLVNANPTATPELVNKLIPCRQKTLNSEILVSSFVDDGLIETTDNILT